MTAAKAEPKGLHAKLAEVMAEADRIPKNGSYTGQGQFKYVLVGDAADAIRGALGSRGVSMLPTSVEVIGETEHETRSGGTMTTLSIRTTWTLTDAETGQTAVIQSIGTGADAGDKASPKAQSNAMKYALLMGFLLSTGDDPEQADTSDRQARPGEEVLEMLGTLQKAGTLVKGTATHYQGEWKETPDGYFIGFRFKLDGDDRDIPQVLIRGSIGATLKASGEALEGAKVTVKGKLYNVRQKGRQSYYRLIVGDHPDSDFIASGDWRVPALDAPAEAPTAPMFSESEQAAIDAEIEKVLG